MGDDARGAGFDAAHLRGLTQRRLSRREVLGYAGMGVGAIGLSSLLAACGIKGTGVPHSTATLTVDDFRKIYGDGTAAGVLDWASWEDYIDVDDKGQSPTLVAFTKATGIKVTYKTAINTNNDFLNKSVYPDLDAGKACPFDLIVITNGGPVEGLIRKGYLTPLDHTYLPNFAANADPTLRTLVYDPGNRYTLTWQSGFTGIAYNSKVVKTPPTSFKDLLNPAYAGRVGMFNNNQDLPCPALAYLGYDVQASGPEQWQKAAELLAKQRDDGVVRAYYDQSYINALENGDTVITQAWSGDAFIAAAPTDVGGDGYPDIKFVMPDEGGVYWHDNLCIPLHAKHPVDAIKMMDFVYRPEVAAQLADFIWYVSPVPASKDIVLNKIGDPLVARSPLVYPTAAEVAAAHQYRVFKDKAEEDQWNSIFEPIYSS